MSIIKRIVIFPLCFFILFGFSPVCAQNKQVYSYKSGEEKKIALTFDDGPHPKKTKKIIDVLEKYGVTATFFVVGVNVKNYNNGMKEIIDRGYEIGNHTFSHKVLKNSGIDHVKNEFLTTENEVKKLGGSVSNLIRPPCGIYDKSLVDFSRENDYKIVLWNIDTKDWEHAPLAQIVKTVESKVKGGDIILFHDYISGKSNTAEALDILIPKLIDLGYEFVSVSELLQENPETSFLRFGEPVLK